MFGLEPRHTELELSSRVGKVRPDTVEYLLDAEDCLCWDGDRGFTFDFVRWMISSCSISYMEYMTGSITFSLNFVVWVLL